jgi:hypothetical protein
MKISHTNQELKREIEFLKKLEQTIPLEDLETSTVPTILSHGSFTLHNVELDLEFHCDYFIMEKFD